ncbi:MAG TPA: maleylacetoacetate isomerase [Pseudomonadales bacterium]|nr:maleylacetoacetate isomerase [Pseudomonadales bacterium]
MDLYGYFRSSAAYRVRIALNLKQVDYRQIPVNLVQGEHRADSFKAVNAQGLVPALALNDGIILTQSTAILEWLEERFPMPSLYPADPIARAQTRALCNIVACDIHPINNLRVLQYLQQTLKIDDVQKMDWYRHWVAEGFTAIEPLLSNGPYAMGDNISMADVYILPQVFNALRFDQDMTPFPKIMACYNACHLLEAFVEAAPANQPDAR